MTYRHLLVHVDSTKRANERIALATTIARRFGARLTGLFAETDSLGASVVGRRSPQQQSAAAARAREAFSSAVSAAGIESDWWHVGSAPYAELLESVVACCRYADVAIFGQHDPEQSRVPVDVVEHVLLGAGRPLLVVPSAGHHADVGKRVVIGWNASREAARAVNDAIPFMREAELVGVLAFQRPPQGYAGRPMPPVDIAAHLAAHGIAARFDRIVQDEDGIGAAEALMNHAFELSADLTVLGSPGNVFPMPRAGDAVRAFFRSMGTPVLFSH